MFFTFCPFAYIFLRNCTGFCPQGGKTWCAGKEKSCKRENLQDCVVNDASSQLSKMFYEKVTIVNRCFEQRLCQLKKEEHRVSLPVYLAYSLYLSLVVMFSCCPFAFICFCHFSCSYNSELMYLQYSSILRWITPPTFNCSLYCIIIIGLMLRLRANLTVSISDSLHKMMPMVGFSFDLRSSWSRASK